MNSTLDTIITWSEVWSLLIPLVVIFLYKPGGKQVRPLIWYVCIAFLLNAIATVMVEFYFSMPAWLKNNNILYNLHSITRVLLFSLYIMQIRQYRYPWILKLLLACYFVFVAVDFIFFEDIFYISSRLFGVESIILLALCLSFFFRSMQDDSETNWLKHPSFLVCTGISLYETTSFFIFLFFYPLVKTNWDFAYTTMSIHNVMYIIMCVMIAVALHRSRQKKAIQQD